MSDPTTPDAVSAAFAALIQALAERALADTGEFDRATGFRAAAIGMRDRWAADELAHARRPRGGKEGV